MSVKQFLDLLKRFLWSGCITENLKLSLNILSEHPFEEMNNFIHGLEGFRSVLMKIEQILILLTSAEGYFEVHTLSSHKYC